MPFYDGMASGGSSRGELPGISLRRKQSHLPGVVENRDRRMTALFSFSCEFCVPWDQESWSLLLGTSLLCCCPSRILHLPGTLSPLEGLLVTEYRAGDSETTCEPSLTSACHLRSLSHLQAPPLLSVLKPMYFYHCSYDFCNLLPSSWTPGPDGKALHPWKVVPDLPWLQNLSPKADVDALGHAPHPKASFFSSRWLQSSGEDHVRY